MTTDIPGMLRTVVDAAGEVSLTYGGFEIRVKSPSEFAWERTLNLLLALQHDVWVTKRGDDLVIMSKPPSI